MNLRMVLPVCAILASCSDREAVPEGLLPRDRFKEVLLEAQLIEARRNHEMVVEQRTDSPMRQYYDSMFAARGVTEEEFSATFDHYASRPEELKAIYEEILAELEVRKDSAR